MSSLKVLKLKGLSRPNSKNFDLDTIIVNYLNTNNGVTSHKPFMIKSGITSQSFYFRANSLSKRGHIKSISEYLTPINEVKQVVSKNTYTNSDGLNKEIARNKMAKYIVDADKSGTVLSLPYSTCAIEKKILLDAPYLTFLGVELDIPTYKDLKQTVKTEKLPIETYQGQLSDKIYGQSENAYSHIIADYCGGLGKFGKEIEYAVQNKIVMKGGIMALTFSKPIRGGKQADELLELGGTITNNVNDNRCKSDKAFEAFFNRIIGTEFEFVEIFNYADDKKDAKGSGYPMVLIVLRRKL